MTTLVTVLLGAILAAEEAEIDESMVSPGVLGFFVTAGFAVAVILLGTNLVRRVRRNQYRAEIREQLEAELAEHDPENRPEREDGQDPSRSGDAGN